jgi:hypothetical protein
MYTTCLAVKGNEVFTVRRNNLTICKYYHYLSHSYLAPCRKLIINALYISTLHNTCQSSSTPATAFAHFVTFHFVIRSSSDSLQELLPFLILGVKELSYSFWHMWLLFTTLFLTSIMYLHIITKSNSGNSGVALRGKFNCSDPWYKLTESFELLSKLLNDKTRNVHMK